MDKSKFVEVIDKDLMVHLVANGFEIKHIKKDYVHPNRSKVYFDRSEEINEAITRFANKNNIINLGDYLAAERRVSTLLYNQKYNAF